MLSLFILFASSKKVYINVKNEGSEICTDKNGCSISEAQKIIENGDEIFIIDKNLSKDESKLLLDFINKTTKQNISVFGSETEVYSPDYPISESASIYSENSTFKIDGFVFSNFKIPILNGQWSNFQISNCVLINSEATVSSIIAFIACNLSLINVTMLNHTANSQSIFIAINSTVTIEKFEFIGNFMESKDIRAALHFVGSNISFKSSEFSSNKMALPIIAASQKSLLSIESSSFHNNDIIVVVAVDHYSNLTIKSTKFDENKGGLVSSVETSYTSLNNIDITHHFSGETLFGITDSNFSLSDVNILESQIGYITFANTNANKVYFCEIKNLNISDSHSVGSLFTQTSGGLITQNISIANLTSEAEIVIISHQNGLETTMDGMALSFISSSLDLSTALASVNTTKINLKSTNFEQNQICGALFENGTISVEDSIFSNNQCFPQGNSLPLAIVTASSSDFVTMTNNVFKNNSALTGAVFFANVTGSITKNTFIGNQAIQGGSIVGNAMNMTVDDSEFKENAAMSNGGVASLVNGSAVFNRCRFIGNTASEGGVFSTKNCTSIIVKDSLAQKNNAENATFINDENSLQIWLPNTEVDDDFAKAMFVSDILNVSESKFNCRVRCMEANPEALKKSLQEKIEEVRKENKDFEEEEKIEDIKIDQGNEEEEVEINSQPSNVYWLMIPIVAIIAIFILLKRLGIKSLLSIPNRLGSKKEQYIL